MGFGDLKSEAGLNSLNSFLTDKSYIEGYVPSQADIAVFEALKGCPPDSLHHACRWYRHIQSYFDVKANLPGEKKDVNSYGSTANGTATNGAAKDDSDSDSDVDLFGSDDEEDKNIREQLKKKEEAAKKSKKVVIAKSSILFEVKPWDDETDMKEIEEYVRSIQMDGLLWGAAKLVPVGYGIKKLTISAVVEDDKVSVEDLEEKITEYESHVQSVDIAAFNKI